MKYLFCVVWFLLQGRAPWRKLSRFTSSISVTLRYMDQQPARKWTPTVGGKCLCSCIKRRPGWKLVEGGFSQNPWTSLRCGGVRPTWCSNRGTRITMWGKAMGFRPEFSWMCKVQTIMHWCLSSCFHDHQPPFASNDWMEMLAKTDCEMRGWHRDDEHPVGFMLRIITSKPKQNRQKIVPLRKAHPLIRVGGVL